MLLYGISCKCILFFSIVLNLWASKTVSKIVTFRHNELISTVIFGQYRIPGKVSILALSSCSLEKVLHSSISHLQNLGPHTLRCQLYDAYLVQSSLFYHCRRCTVVDVSYFRTGRCCAAAACPSCKLILMRTYNIISKTVRSLDSVLVLQVVSIRVGVFLHWQALRFRQIIFTKVRLKPVAACSHSNFVAFSSLIGIRFRTSDVPGTCAYMFNTNELDAY